MNDNSLKTQANLVLSLIDLTSLNNNDNRDTIIKLCQHATTAYGSVAAICIFSHLILDAKNYLNTHNKNIKIATVVNFPHGFLDIELAKFETKLAIDRGADEIDLVFPYHTLIQGKDDLCHSMIGEVRKVCLNKTLKVIIESGELIEPQLIEQASKICIENDVDFIKTSTGKVQVGATLDAATIMLQTIKNSGKQCGFKASGGIKTLLEANKYIELAQSILGTHYINPKTFRFGASSLLNDVLSHLENNPSLNKNMSSNY